MIAVVHCRPFKISSIVLWKVLALPFKLNGIEVNSYCPYFEQNAVFGMSSFLTWIWRYRAVQSKFEKKLELATASRQSDILGSGKAQGFTSSLTFG